MTREQVFKKVQEVIVESLDVEISEVTPTATLADDLGADSMDLASLATFLEEELGVTIELARLQNIATVDDVVDLIQTLLKDGNA